MNLSKFPPDYDSITEDLLTLQSSPDITNLIVKFFSGSNTTQNCEINGGVTSKSYTKIKVAEYVEPDFCKIDQLNHATINVARISVLALSFTFALKLLF